MLFLEGKEARMGASGGADVRTMQRPPPSVNSRELPSLPCNFPSSTRRLNSSGLDTLRYSGGKTALRTPGTAS